MKNNYRAASRIINAAGSESALKILEAVNHNRRLCVSDLAQKIGLSLSATSHQLRRLESAGLIYPVRSGRMACYRIREGKFMQTLTRCLKNFVVLAGKIK